MNNILKLKRIIKKDFNYISGKKYDNMMSRCYRKTDRSYKNYGLKGIKVCSSWILNIDHFRDWLRAELNSKSITEDYFLINSKNLQLDRIDPTGHYTPENCRLVSNQMNVRNRFITKGKEIISAEGIKLTFGE